MQQEYQLRGVINKFTSYFNVLVLSVVLEVDGAPVGPFEFVLVVNSPVEPVVVVSPVILVVWLPVELVVPEAVVPAVAKGKVQQNLYNQKDYFT